MARVRSSLAEGDSMLVQRVARTELPDSFDNRQRAGLKRKISLRDSSKRKLLAMPPEQRQKTKLARLAPLPKMSKGFES